MNLTLEGNAKGIEDEDTECGSKHITRKDLQTCGWLTEDAEAETWWLHEMNEPMRGHLQQVLYKVWTSKEYRDFKIYELNPAGARAAYEMFYQELGMEKGLENLIKGAHEDLESAEGLVTTKILHTESISPQELEELLLENIKYRELFS